MRRKTIHSEASDAALLGGDATAFGAFYRRHEDAMLAYFLRRTREAELAADLTAETFARALAGRRNFDAMRGEARGWLFGIARHVLATSLERGRVDDETRRRLGMEQLVLSHDVIAEIEALDGGVALDALAVLPPDQAVAVSGRVIDDLPYDELADRLDCSESVVRQRVSRGLKTLKAQMEGRS